MLPLRQSLFIRCPSIRLHPSLLLHPPRLRRISCPQSTQTRSQRYCFSSPSPHNSRRGKTRTLPHQRPFVRVQSRCHILLPELSILRIRGSLLLHLSLLPTTFGDLLVGSAVPLAKLGLVIQSSLVLDCFEGVLAVSCCGQSRTERPGR